MVRLVCCDIRAHYYFTDNTLLVNSQLPISKKATWQFGMDIDNAYYFCHNFRCIDPSIIRDWSESRFVVSWQLMETVLQQILDSHSAHLKAVFF